jgi:hypothetical protein
MNLFSEWRDTSQMLAYFFAFQKEWLDGRCPQGLIWTVLD